MRLFAFLAALLVGHAAAAQTPADTLDFSDVTPEIVGGLAALQQTIVYPSADRDAGRQGTVILRFVVTAAGAPAAVRVVRGVSPGLDSAAVAGVRAARFVPGRENGVPVNVRMAIPIRFSIRDEPGGPSAPPRRVDVGALRASLGSPRISTGIPPADSVQITQSPIWGEMARFTWFAPGPGLERIDAYSSTDTLRFVALTFAPGAATETDGLRRRLADSHARTQDDGYVLAYDLATSGLDGAADLRIDVDHRRVTYRQPLCRDGGRPEACAPPFPTLVGGLKALQESVTYPTGARQAGISGQVDVEVSVRADGSVSAIRATNVGARDAGARSLAEAALAAVARARFAPAVRAGVPVASTLVIPVRFVIL